MSFSLAVGSSRPPRQGDPEAGDKVRKCHLNAHTYNPMCLISTVGHLSRVGQVTLPENT